MRWPFKPRRPVIEFLCQSENFDALPAPVPAAKVIPDWFKDLAPVNKSYFAPGSSGITVKRCMPFLTALTEGWIVFSPADIQFDLSENGGAVVANNAFPEQLILSHMLYQYEGSHFSDKAVIKIHTQWVLKTAPGWSALVTQPFNRGAELQILSGIIDADRFNQQLVLPLYFTRPDGLFTLPKGTPLAQVIPFRRGATPGVARVMSEGENVTWRRQTRAIFSESGWYRKNTYVKR